MNHMDDQDELKEKIKKTYEQYTKAISSRDRGLLLNQLAKYFKISIDDLSLREKNFEIRSIEYGLNLYIVLLDKENGTKYESSYRSNHSDCIYELIYVTITSKFSKLRYVYYKNADLPICKGLFLIDNNYELRLEYEKPNNFDQLFFQPNHLLRIKCSKKMGKGKKCYYIEIIKFIVIHHILLNVIKLTKQIIICT